MERLLASHIMDYLEQKEILSDKQFIFRKERGTENQKPLAYSEVAKWVDEGKVVVMAYLDFPKAFDVVSHLLLLDKLQLLGSDPIVISWIKSFLIGRTMSVSVSGTTSFSMPVTSRVPQESEFGPLLFLINVNSITVAVAGYWIAFADDFKLCVCYPIKKLYQKRQADTSLSWNLKLNPANCVIMMFGDKSVTDQFVFNLQHQLALRRLV